NTPGYIANLHKLYDKCAELVGCADVEIILVDNGSTDDTADILATFDSLDDKIKINTVDENQGYGFGILSGLEVSNGDYIGWTHADLQTDPLDYLKVIKTIEEAPGEPCFVKGERFGRPLADVFFTTGMSIFETLLMGTRMSDINAQPTVFPSAFYQSWRREAPYDFSLDLFVYYLAKEQGLPVKRVPVYFGAREFGQSHWNVDLKSKFKFIQRTVSFSLSLRRNI
ncbi:MAG: glycosyltransferase, partial [Opitutae bacterium]